MSIYFKFQLIHWVDQDHRIQWLMSICNSSHVEYCFVRKRDINQVTLDRACQLLNQRDWMSSELETELTSKYQAYSPKLKFITLIHKSKFVFCYLSIQQIFKFLNTGILSWKNNFLFRWCEGLRIFTYQFSHPELNLPIGNSVAMIRANLSVSFPCLMQIVTYSLI